MELAEKFSCTREVRDRDKKLSVTQRMGGERPGLSWSAQGTNQNLGDILPFGKETTARLSRVSLVSQWQRNIRLITLSVTLLSSTILSVRAVKKERI